MFSALASFRQRHQLTPVPSVNYVNRKVLGKKRFPPLVENCLGKIIPKFTPGSTRAVDIQDIAFTQATCELEFSRCLEKIVFLSSGERVTLLHKNIFEYALALSLDLHEVEPSIGTKMADGRVAIFGTRRAVAQILSGATSVWYDKLVRNYYFIERFKKSSKSSVFPDIVQTVPGGDTPVWVSNFMRSWIETNRLRRRFTSQYPIERRLEIFTRVRLSLFKFVHKLTKAWLEKSTSVVDRPVLAGSVDISLPTPSPAYFPMTFGHPGHWRDLVSLSQQIPGALVPSDWTTMYLVSTNASSMLNSRQLPGAPPSWGYSHFAETQMREVSWFGVKQEVSVISEKTVWDGSMSMTELGAFHDTRLFSFDTPIFWSVMEFGHPHFLSSRVRDVWTRFVLTASQATGLGCTAGFGASTVSVDDPLMASRDDEELSDVGSFILVSDSD